jgi:23S rRNA (adenine2503-C2)-methyltransferase
VDVIEKLESLQVPNFRKEQILHAIFKESKSSFAEVLTLPKDLRAELDASTPLRTLTPLKTLVSANGDTIKWSFLTSKNQPIEAVLMLHSNGRRTLCVSCQSGCPVNCSFCWTGAMGFRHNLSSWEIIEQVLVANQWIKENPEVLAQIETKEVFSKGEPMVTRVVYMGMGEPMINLVEVTKSVKTLMDPRYFGIGQRSITVSTSGYIPMMRTFWGEFPKIGLAISLHAPNQELRAELMPVAKQFKLDALIQVCRDIQKQTKRRATYEYILIDGITDTEECAVQLADLLRGQLAHVNVIPYNPIEGRDFKRPSRNRVMKFCHILESYGLSATPRVTMGDDIKAACGQLSKHEEDL